MNLHILLIFECFKLKLLHIALLDLHPGVSSSFPFLSMSLCGPFSVFLLLIKAIFQKCIYIPNEIKFDLLAAVEYSTASRYQFTHCSWIQMSTLWTADCQLYTGRRVWGAHHFHICKGTGLLMYGTRLKPCLFPWCECKFPDPAIISEVFFSTFLSLIDIVWKRFTRSAALQQIQ